jgi:signal-transduction protein with cAMP-binding, CBS, and nucleotidyltransferase domain
MQQQNTIMLSNNAAFLDTLLGEVKEFLSLLDREESIALLDHLQGEVDLELIKYGDISARHRILLEKVVGSCNYSELNAIHDDLNALEMERFLLFRSVPALHKSCTEYRDLLADRTVKLVTEEMVASGRGEPPVQFALISMGSDGREEQTLITDQDYLIVYEDGGGDAADSYFKEFSELLVDRLEEVGFKKCTGGIMPSNPTWRGSLSQWSRRLLAIVRYEYEDYAKNMMDLIVISDARYVGGDQKLASVLIEHIRTLEQDYFHVLWGMAKAATEMRLALGFMKRLWTEGAKEHKGEFNLKLLAWAPLVMNVRILSINQAIPATNTIMRLELLGRERSLSAATVAGLVEAYHVLTRHRILLQIKVIKGIQKDSYHINPYGLPAEEREKIRQALLLIEELQKTIHVNFSIV